MSLEQKPEEKKALGILLSVIQKAESKTQEIVSEKMQRFNEQLVDESRIEKRTVKASGIFNDYRDAESSFKYERFHAREEQGLIKSMMRKTEFYKHKYKETGVKIFQGIFDREAQKKWDKLEAKIVSELNLGGKTIGDFILDKEDERYKDAKEPLIRGDLAQFSIEKWSPADYPELHQSIPVDLSRPLLSDGRLVDGSDVPILQPRLVNREMISRLYSATASHVMKEQYKKTFFLAGIFMFLVFFQFGGLLILGDIISVSVRSLSDLTNYLLKPTFYIPFIFLNAILFAPLVFPEELAGDDKKAGFLTVLANFPKRCVPNSFNTRVYENMFWSLITVFLISLSCLYLVSTSNSSDVDREYGSTNMTSTYAQSVIFSSGKDLWNVAHGQELVNDANSRRNLSRLLVTNVSNILQLLIAALGLIGIYSGIKTFAFGRAGLAMMRPQNVKGAVQDVMNSDLELNESSPNSGSRWSSRFEQRAVENRAYRMQINNALEDKSPLIKIGTGTGTIEYRGGLQGAQAGQDMCMSINDLHQHLAVFGGTGSGKTHLLKKLIAQLIAADRPGYQQSLLITDGKGVLWEDARDVAAEMGAPFRVIGARPGHMGVDLFDGMEPHIIADIIGQVMSSGGNGDGKFFESMAIAIVQASLVIAKAYELTPEGAEQVRATGELIYSPVGVYKLAMSVRDSKGAINKAIAAICATAKTNRDALVGADGPDLEAALELILLDLKQYPDATAGSFLAHITNALGGFGTVGELRRRFGTGRAYVDEIIEIERIWDKDFVTGVALSPIEFGASARTANILLTSRVYHLARMKNIKDPEIGKKQKLGMFIDELPALVTPSTSEVSIIGFAPVARSSGVFLVVGLQGASTLRSAMGESLGGSRTESLLAQFRSKVFLQTADTETSSLVISLAGTGLEPDNKNPSIEYQNGINSLTFDPESSKNSLQLSDFQVMHLAEAPEVISIGIMSWESYWEKVTARDKSGKDINMLNTVSKTTGSKIINYALLRADALKLDPMLFTQEEKSFENDSPTIFLNRYGEVAPQEFAGRKWIKPETQNLMRPSDMVSFSRKHAFAYIMRAGHVRMDVIELAS